MEKRLKEIIKCPCGKVFTTFPCRIGRKKYCSKKCFYTYHGRPSGLQYKVKTKNRAWFLKGGKPWNHNKHDYSVNRMGSGYINTQGYKVYSQKGKEVLEHRILLEKVLKRPLKKDELVHHINAVKLDNRLHNLLILTRSEHIKLHHLLRRSE